MNSHSRFSNRLLIRFVVCCALAGSILRLAGAEGDLTPEEVHLGHSARTLLAKPRTGNPLQVDSASPSEVAAHVRLVRSHPRLGGIRTLETDGTENVLEVIKRLTATGHYEYVEPDYIRQKAVVPNDPSFASSQWSLNNTGQNGGTPGADIGAVAAWDIIHDAPDVTVAVMDTGLSFNHSDIIDNLWRNPGESGGRVGFDDDGNGYTDDVLGINATVAKTSSLATNPNDTDGHGSHVSGIIGASGNNGKGISGIAWSTKIMPLKFIGPSGGLVSNEVACLDYAIAKGANVINGSYASSTFSQTEFDALKRVRDAGIVMVVAAGNDGQEISSQPEYPAAYLLDNIIAVAATNNQDNLASYSTYGSGLVELAAPGSSILSLGISSPTAYVTLSGTSMAAPLVAAEVAVLASTQSGWTAAQIVQDIMQSAHALNALPPAKTTYGSASYQPMDSASHSMSYLPTEQYY